MVRPAAKQEAVAHLRDQFQMSERQACRVITADRKMVRYQSRRPPETELRERLRLLANEHRRFGYRRLFIMLRREGETSGINRIYLCPPQIEFARSDDRVLRAMGRAEWGQPVAPRS